ncbi:MAG: single-stranded DNA-binding protein, partial [Clostridiales bacterium]|nr:single-stranded DNA-binding protein [Clostridiales bacterium]
MNKVILKGRLTAEPEIKYTQGAEPVAVARFGVAVSRGY